MEKRAFEKLGAETGLLGFGAMRLICGKDGEIDYKPNERMIDMAMAGGVNYYDTAYVYHAQKSEGFLGDALVSRYPRDRFLVATKLPPHLVTDEARALEILDEQLARLKTDHIDFYLMHGPSWDQWQGLKAKGILSFLERARGEGKVRRAGFSSHDSVEGFRKVLNDYPWDFTQLQVNYADWIDQDAETKYGYTVEAGVPLAIMEPVRGGNLSREDVPAVKALKALLPEGVTPASVAFRWAAQLKNAYVILSGMSLPEQVEENLRTFSPVRPLAEAELAAIEEARRVLHGLPTVPCTGCRYCDGCPQGINIPWMLSKYNDYLAYQNANNFFFGYPKEKERPEDCVACGACVSACPQHIQVPDELKKVAQVAAQLSAAAAGA